MTQLQHFVGEKVAVKMATCPSNDPGNEIKKPKKYNMAKDKVTKRQKDKMTKQPSSSIFCGEKVAVKRATCPSNDPGNEIKKLKKYNIAKI